MSMQQIITPPPIRPPANGLFTSAIELDTADSHLVNGATWLQEPTGYPGILDPQCNKSSTLGPQTPASTRNAHTFDVWVESHCAPMADIDLQNRGTRHLLAAEQYQAENEFWTGALHRAQSITDGQYLTDTNLVDATVRQGVGPSGGVKSPTQALAVLEEYLADALTGQQGMIHCTRTVGTWWNENNLLYKVGNITRTKTSDTIVVIGAGYDGSGANHVVTGNVSGRYQTAIATDMVWFWRDQILVTGRDTSESLDRTLNTMSYRAQRPILIGFDGQAQGAVHIDLCASPCSAEAAVGS